MINARYFRHIKVVVSAVISCRFVVLSGLTPTAVAAAAAAAAAVAAQWLSDVERFGSDRNERNDGSERAAVAVTETVEAHITFYQRFDNLARTIIATAERST